MTPFDDEFDKMEQDANWVFFGDPDDIDPDDEWSPKEDVKFWESIEREAGEVPGPYDDEE